MNIKLKSIPQLNQAWLQAKERWQALSSRDKKTACAGAAALSLFILYAGIWSPIMSHLDSLRSSIHTQQKTLAWMQSANIEIQKLEKEGTTARHTVSPVSLLTYLQLKINQLGLTANLAQMKQSSNDAIDLQFKQVPSDKLLTLLLTVLKEQAVSVTRMSATADNTPGVITATVTLSVEDKTS